MTDQPPTGSRTTASLAAEIVSETAALNTLLGAYASKADVIKRLEDERRTTTALIKQRDRGRKWLVGAITAAVLIAVICSVWAVNVSRRVDSESRARETDRVQRAAASCQQSNVTRNQINAGNTAKRAIEAADVAIQRELDGLLEPIVNPASPPATAAAAASLAVFKQHYEEGRATVSTALVDADNAINRAEVPLRDCSKPDDPAAFLPTTTTSTTLAGG